jgi:hypothetical protein
VQELNKRLPRFFTLGKAYRTAAAVLILVAACAIVWSIVSKQKKNDAGAITQKSPGSSADTAGYVAIDIQRDTVGVTTRHLVNDSNPFFPGETLYGTTGNNSRKETDPPIIEERNIHSAVEGKSSLQVIPVVPEQKEKLIAGNTLQEDRKRIDLAADSKENPKSNYTTNNFFASGKEAQKRSSSGRWQLGIVGGTNIAMVKGDVSATPGLNTGILVQHRINDSRISLESGVIYENMTYAVENEYFNPGGKPVSSKVSNISGTCTMIDVPVNVRYDMVHSKKRKAFVSTGVSPTVMVKQSYVYDYTDENGTRLIDRDVTGQGKNFYAVANVSVGYEQKWNKTSVQVAPYLKIPMGEIGYGNLSLGGIGTQVSIKRDL